MASFHSAPGAELHGIMFDWKKHVWGSKWICYKYIWNPF